jgi:hypothetical protein
MNPITVITPNELEIRVERGFNAPRTHVFSVWTDPKLIPETRRCSTASKKERRAASRA